MSLGTRTIVALSCLTLAGLLQPADAQSRSKRPIQVNAMTSIMPQQQAFVAPQQFLMQDAPLGENAPPAKEARSVSLQGTTIETYGGDVLALDADSGELVRTDHDGKRIASVEIGAGAAQMVVDRGRSRAYVSDRNGDRVVVVDLSRELRVADSFATPTEPFGLALTPDGKTLLVTTVADRTLLAYSTESGTRRWSKTIGPEPRGVAVSPDGSQALVTFLTAGVVGRFSPGLDEPSISYLSLDPATPSATTDRFGSALAPGQTRAEDEGRSFARNAFGATFVGHGIAVVPHQLSTPHLPDDGAPVTSGGYGGGDGFTPPVQHRLAFLAAPEGNASGVRTAFASAGVHQPRAMAYDPGTDTLVFAGFGSDNVLAVADVSQATVHLAWQHTVTGGACGPNGLSIDPDDGDVVMFCSLDRTTVRLTPNGNAAVQSGRSAELAKSHLSASAQRGREVFRRGNSQQISSGGAMACSNCHAEGRTDGLTWFLQGNILQTPLLTGRVMGSHPFKWDGKDSDLDASLTNTVGRLGGTGLTRREVQDLAAFLASSEPPRAPATEDRDAVARGKALFESETTGCAECHYGPLLTDQQRHEMAPDLGEVDTPSLIGLAQSAPYYHDGSAQTLEALLRGKGNIHGMGRTSKLDEPQVSDLVAYLETL